MKEKHMKAMEDWARAVNKLGTDFFAYFTVTTEPLFKNTIVKVELEILNDNSEAEARIYWLGGYWWDHTGRADTGSKIPFDVPLRIFNEKASRANLPPLILEP